MTASSIDLPPGQAAVRVWLVDTSCTFSIRAENFVEPLPSGGHHLDVANHCFLIEHETSGVKIMFDLSMRKDYWNLPPVVLGRLSTGVAISGLNVPRDAMNVLDANGVDSKEISAVVWSHYHYDHIGDMTRFPSSTSLIVGPGLKNNQNIMPGFPDNPSSPVPSAYFTGRSVLELQFEDGSLTIGGFQAHDYFGDGSFYLLDTPGHCKGHICGLARTTAGPESSFIFLGGDICHNTGCFRPSVTYPLCPEDIHTYFHPEDNSMESVKMNDSGSMRTIEPLHKISTSKLSAYVDPHTAQTSVDKLAAFDASPAVLVLLAHDPSLTQYLPTISLSVESSLNGWRRQGWKDLCRWYMLHTKPSAEPAMKGFWRDGRPWSAGREVLAEKSAGVSGSGL